MSKREPAACAECGHLHFVGDGYIDCPIQGCACKGQDWAREVVVVGWDGHSNPIRRYADELHLPDHQRKTPA